MFYLFFIHDYLFFTHGYRLLIQGYLFLQGYMFFIQGYIFFMQSILLLIYYSAFRHEMECSINYLFGFFVKLDLDLLFKLILEFIFSFFTYKVVIFLFLLINARFLVSLLIFTYFFICSKS